jgi:hypothetical protein
MAKFILLFVIVFAVLIILMRLFGAWMLRINEIIFLLKDIRGLLENKELGATHLSTTNEIMPSSDATKNNTFTETRSSNFDEII